MTSWEEIYQKAIHFLVNRETGKLHSKINKEFYEKRKEVQDSGDSKKILEFVKVNYDIERKIGLIGKM